KRLLRSIRKRQSVPRKIVERVKGRLRIARAAERPSHVAGVLLQRLALGTDEGIAKKEKRVPSLDAAAKIMDRLGLRTRAVFDRNTRVGEDQSCCVPQRLGGLRVGLYGVHVVHAGVANWLQLSTLSLCSNAPASFIGCCEKASQYHSGNLSIPN